MTAEGGCGLWVVPAYAGLKALRELSVFWIPVFTGMTAGGFQGCLFLLE